MAFVIESLVSTKEKGLEMKLKMSPLTRRRLEVPMMCFAKFAWTEKAPIMIKSYIAIGAILLCIRLAMVFLMCLMENFTVRYVPTSTK